MENENLQKKSEELREKIINYHYRTNTPHVGGDLSIIEILTVLYYEVMKKQDSFILSKGHSAGALYTVLNDKGLIPDSELYNLEEHPTLNKQYGIEATTGSLGHGLSLGLGMAIANKNNKIYVLMGDGECDEGQVWEAARLTSELELNNLIGIVDCNGWQGFKKADYSKLGNKFTGFGWQTKWCDGHNCEDLSDILRKDYNSPLMVLAKTIKGRGIEKMENKLESHYMKL
jgi:transketolase